VYLSCDVVVWALVKASIAGHVSKPFHDASRYNALAGRKHTWHNVTPAYTGHTICAILKRHGTGKHGGGCNLRKSWPNKRDASHR